MKLSKSLIENLRKLISGKAIAYSSLSLTMSDSLLKERLLSVEYHGTKRLLRATNTEALRAFLPHYNEALRDLGKAYELLENEGSRAKQASLSGNSKIKAARSCPGFLVNSYHRVECQLGDKSIVIDPQEGCAVYISDWRNFLPSSTALIVGVENMENFLKIRNQVQLIESFMNVDETCVLFVSRYAFSSDLGQWLEMIPNRYLHFGDFDLAGIDIFLSQFKPHVGKRGSFLIPKDIEERISHGSRERYNDQYVRYTNLSTEDLNLSRLIYIIHRFRRTYDQEGYID